MFNEKLKEVLKDSKITMYKMAKDLHLNKQTVINWTKGITEPTVSKLKAICMYLDVSADYLLGLKEY